MQRRTLLAFVACAFAACKVSAPKALRIVSTSPSMTEVVFGLGMGDKLVGRSTFCDEPPEAQKIPTVGGFANPNLETIVSLQPSLVIGERGPAGPSLPAALGKMGIDTYFPDMRTVAEIRAMIHGLGERLARADEAKTIVAGIDATIASVTERIRGLTAPKTLFLFDYTPLVAAGPASFPDELLKLAGGRNVVQSGGQYPKLSAEGLTLLDPDVIVDGTNGAYTEAPAVLMKQVPGSGSLRAVKEARLSRLPSSAALRPGPRIGKGVEELARILHGGAMREQ